MSSTGRRSAAGRGWRPLAGLFLLLVGASAPPASAQPVLSVHQDLDFDRPEAWALKYFSSVTLLTGLGAPERREAGSLELALEGGWIPSLSEDERRVGFYGTKVEDLNKTSVFGRPRLTVGLPAALTLTLAWAPPIELGGAEPNLWAVALGRPLVEREGWRLGARLYAQGGTVKGDFTCSADDAAGGDDPIANPFGCERPSQDEATLQAYGVELAAAWQASERLEPYAALTGTYLDPEFQVDAFYSGIHDRTRQTTDGTTWALTAGLAWARSERLRLVAEAFYAPLTLVRTAGAEEESQDLFNLRVLLGYRLR
ncbi:MAG TPA: hypothetical protein VF017_04920 [Thermoanaerobaculia bacterium]|nr:hypothetical protein [Thermoanaerobaculia bacterium]